MDNEKTTTTPSSSSSSSSPLTDNDALLINIVVTFISVLGALINLNILSKYYRSFRHVPSGEKLLINLIVADFLSCLEVLAFAVNTFLGSNSCMAMVLTCRMSLSLSAVTSCLTMALIANERYRIVVLSKSYQSQFKLNAFTWLFPFLLGVVPTLCFILMRRRSGYNFKHRRRAVVLVMMPDLEERWGTFHLVSSYFWVAIYTITLIWIPYCYFRIFYLTRETRKNLESRKVQSSYKVNSDVYHPHPHQHQRHASQDVTQSPSVSFTTEANTTLEDIPLGTPYASARLDHKQSVSDMSVASQDQPVSLEAHTLSTQLSTTQWELTKKLLAYTIVFYIGWLPITVCFQYSVVSGGRLPRTLYVSVVCVQYFSWALNGVVTLLYNPYIRKQVKESHGGVSSTAA